jgi:hypothetical protein
LSIESGFCEVPRQGKEFRYSNPGALHVVFGPADKLVRQVSGDRIAANQRMYFILMALCGRTLSEDGWTCCGGRIEGEWKLLYREI